MTSKLDINALNAELARVSAFTLTDTELGRRPLAGISMPEDQRLAIGKANKGVTRALPAWTEERKTAAAAVVAKRTAERNAKRAAGEVIKVFSDEARKNISLAGKGRKQSAEARQKRSESMKRTLALKKQLAGKFEPG